jgi:hypothetical protein
MWLFINSKEKSRYDFIYAILFALIMIPKHYIISVAHRELDWASILNPVFMMIICALIIVEKVRKNA